MSVAEHLFAGEDPVMLISTFQMREDASADRLIRLWTQVANLMKRRPGFVSSRLYRRTMGSEAGEYIMVAQWSCAMLLAAAQADPEIRSVEREVHNLLISVRRVLCEPATETITPHD